MHSSFNSYYKPSSKYILHVDGDCFFASCEVAIDPNLRGKCVVTGKERGIVSSMTYDAKARGVIRGMPMFQLKKLYPDITIVSSDYLLYTIFSRRMINIVKRYSESVHEYSIDECFADLTPLIEKGNNPLKVLAQIKFDLQNELGMTFSVGLAPTKVLAKIASKTRKPDGLTFITHADIKNFLKDVPIQRVWGIGKETSTLLFKNKITTALEFISYSEDVVRGMVSKPYYEIYQELQGISVLSCDDDSKREASKSISRTRMFPAPTSLENMLHSELSRNVEEACSALRREKLVSGYMSFFLKSQDFRYYRYEVAIPHRTASPEDILQIISCHFDKIYQKGMIYRASGVTLMNLINNEIHTPDFFGNYKKVEKRKDLYEVIDSILKKQGSGSVSLASSFISKKARIEKEPSRETFINHLPFPYLGEVH